MQDPFKELASLSPEQRRLVLMRAVKMRQQNPQPNYGIIPVQIRDGRPFPISHAQQPFWFLSRLAPESASYNMHAAFRLSGEVDAAVLQASLDDVIHRHEALRTSFGTQNGSPVQIIHSDFRVRLNIIDLSDIHEAERENEALRLVAEEVQRPFDLSTGLLLRVSLFQLDAQHSILLLTVHHIVCDGMSWGILLREIGHLYSDRRSDVPLALPELSVQYADFSVWQLQQTQHILDRNLSYWRTQLQGHLPTLELPTERPRPSAQRFRGHSLDMSLLTPLCENLYRLSKQRGASIFAVILAAFTTLMHRYTQETDILVGTASANRNRVELENLVGCFVNTLVLRIDLSGDLTFLELLTRTQEVIMGANEHQDMPFEKLVEELQPSRDTSRNPLFQVMVSMEQALTLQMTGMEISPIWVENYTSKFDLTLDIVESESKILLSFEYNTDLFGADAINRMMGHLHTLLEVIASHPDQRLSELPILTAAERDLFLTEWNGDGRDHQGGKLFPDLFTEQAEQNPKAIAVAFEGKQLTYKDLNSKANKLGRYLRSLGVGPDVLVGILLERSLDLIVAVMGVLKAGGAYVPLDPTFPKDRLDFMIDDSKISIVLTTGKLATTISSLGISSVCIDVEENEIARQRDEVPYVLIHAEHMAYMIYTSGSTGQPKGVSVSHGNLASACSAWEEAYKLRDNATCHLQMAAFSFDVFVGDMARALSTGGKLVLCPRHLLMDPQRLYGLMRNELVDCAEFVPAVLRNLISYLELTGQRLDFMRLLVVGSDTWYMYEYMRTKELCSTEMRLINSYGVTEATVDSTYFELTNTESHSLTEPVPIGRPFANTRVYVLDDKLQLVPVGVTGELYIGGAGVARGYFNHPELTAKKFIPDPFSNEPGDRLYETGDLATFEADGTIKFLGRSDEQIKIRGFRIEPGEVETAIKHHEGVQESVVVARDDLSIGTALVAYIVAVPSHTSTTAEELRSFLKERIPAYMVPSFYVWLDTLPLNPNGKVDRRGLPAPTLSTREFTHVPPRNPHERALVEIWQEVLGIDRIGVLDDFFALGGHSLLVTQVVFRVSEAFGLDFPLDMLFGAPTVAGMAEAIDELKEKAERKRPERKTLLDLNAEVVLESAINGKQEPREHFPTPGFIFLTGATGFVGAHLLAELLEHTEAQVYCLVRATDIKMGRYRIKAALEAYDLWKEGYGSRTVPIIGDLSQAYLGLSASGFKKLAHKLDVIYHCGYWVNFTYPYEMLKPVNVNGIKEILRLACEEKVKPVHVISSLSVFSPHVYAASVVREDDSLEHSTGLRGGYNQSKWVAEKLLMVASERGIPVSVYRPGFIGGHSVIGMCNPKDLLWRLLKGCVQLRTAPLLDAQINFVPVDYVCKAIVHLSMQSRHIGQAFHLLNSLTISWKTIVEKIEARGYPIQLVSYGDWLAELVEHSKGSEENALFPFLPLFQEQALAAEILGHGDALEFDHRNTSEGLTDPFINCPKPDDLFEVYLTQFISNRFFPSQSKMRSSRVRNSSAQPRTAKKEAIEDITTKMTTDNKGLFSSLNLSTGDESQTAFTSAQEMLKLLQTGELSSVELLDMHIERIERYNGRLNAIVVKDYERAREAAAAADAARMRGEEVPLLGLPVSIKESITVEGLPNTGGDPGLAEEFSQRDGRLSASVRAAGAVIIGKSNVAFRLADWQTNNPVYGRTNNPYDLSRTPGGSSGGGAVAVAAGLTPLDFGSDLIGSIRIPAAFCGVYGHKPSESILPKNGQVPGPKEINVAMVMGTQGPLARTAEDLELALDVLAGPEATDDIAWRLQMPPARHERLSEYRVAILPPVKWLPLDDSISQGIEELESLLIAVGAKVKVTQPQHFGDLRHYFRLGLSLVAAQIHLALPTEKRLRLAEETRREGDGFSEGWAEGIAASAADYINWIGLREEYREAYRAFFQQWDILLAPITLCPAFPHIEGTCIWMPPSVHCTLNVGNRAVEYSWQGLYPCLASICGQPATTFPVKRTLEGLPIGLQAIGPYLEDRTTIRFAGLVARELGGFHPPLGYDDSTN